MDQFLIDKCVICYLLDKYDLFAEAKLPTNSLQITDYS